jgi:hypothetical protein
MHFIDHIVEPTRLYLAWQPTSEDCHTRYIVGELLKEVCGDISLRYFLDTKDVNDAIKAGFDGYLAFPALEKVHHNVLDSFLRRIPPRERGDFTQYLEGLRLHPEAQLSDFALLGYSGAKLLSDGFSLIHPFDNVAGTCELMTEVSGFRHYVTQLNSELKVGDTVSLAIECNDVVSQRAVRVTYGDQLVGYINRGLKDTFIDWITNKRLVNAFVEKVNATSHRPAMYIFIQIKSC